MDFALCEIWTSIKNDEKTARCQQRKERLATMEVVCVLKNQATNKNLGCVFVGPR